MKSNINLVEYHFLGQKIAPIPYSSWLACDKQKVSKVVIAHSGRYSDLKVDYGKVLKGDELFLGLPYEAEQFNKRTGFNLKSKSTSNALKLAEKLNVPNIIVRPPFFTDFRFTNS